MGHVIDNNLPSPITTPSRRSIGDIRRVIIITTLVFTLLGAILGIAWLLLRPYKPKFVVTSLSLSNFSVSKTKLKGDSNILIITIRNTNRNAYLVIDPFQVYVYHNDTQISVATVRSSINLQSMSTIEMKGELGMGDFSNSVVAENPKTLEVNDSMLRDRLKLWTVTNGDFVVKMSIRVRVKSLHRMLKWRMNLDVNCRLMGMHLFVAHDTWNVLGLGFCDVLHQH
ncbi:hypothetical protein VNO77_36736 [Canavalia gladiata]|uniref:Late embryogenesis abundant protein LEA-2 subgroup domain-containing protein n=1 Tax=Canavalia gladiata TaxID=3824 RepID=A0AAN9PWD4_CANGL